jgi:hypothetical protein
VKTIQWSRGRVLLTLVGGFWLVFLLAGDHPVQDLSWHLTEITGPYRFHLAEWEVATLARRARMAIFPSSPVADPVQTVVRYFALGQQENVLTGQQDHWLVRQASDPTAAERARALQTRIDRIEATRETLKPAVEQIISEQVDAQLHQDGVRPGLLTFHRSNQFPFLRPWLIPGVFFGLSRLPHLLVVAPRDRIEIISTALLDTQLSPRASEQIETSTDRLGVSSVVIQIGGLAAYPAMIPTDESLSDTLITIAHEWAFHYLALHPLGERYFASYDMATINESLVDLVGHEVGPQVYDRYYRPALEAEAAKAGPAPTSTAPPATPAPPSFETLLRHIRIVVQADLARGDVASADAYMAQQQRALLQDGYDVPRLNTAYLAFYGWYAEGGNPYAPLLVTIRRKSGSLRAFLADVQNVTGPAQLRQLAAEPASALRWHGG